VTNFILWEKILTKSSLHPTAFVLQLLITSYASYISLSDVHLTATIRYCLQKNHKDVK